MEKLTFNKNNYTMAHGVFRLPVPDGYHYGSNSGDGNENWFYMVPENISLYENHIDAKPFSFAVTTISLGQIPFDVQRADAYKEVLVKVGVLSSDTAVDNLIISSDCAFFYQCWTGEDKLYHKMNGVLFAGSDVYKFHIIANYNTPKATEDGVPLEFMETALTWMGKVSYLGDTPYQLTDMDSCQNDVAGFIDEASNLVSQARGILGITMDFDAELRKHFVTLGGLLYQNHNIALTRDSVAKIAVMVGKIGGREFDVTMAREIMNFRFGNIHDYLEDFHVTSVIKQLIKLDKMGNMAFGDGLSHSYFDAVELFLRILCLKNNISFAESDIYIGYKAGGLLTIESIWDSLNVQVFSGGSSPIREPGYSASNAAQKSCNKPKSSKISEITCTKVKKSECTIDEIGVLESYNGNDSEIILPSGIKEIGADAFSLNKTLRVVVIPEGVQEIGNDAFWGCEALEQVFLPSTLEKIECNAFRNCESLAEIIIPDGVWSIGVDAFTGCKNLKDIYVPSSAFSIEADAFYTFNDDTVIHTPQWSSAETYAEENDMRFDHRQAPVRSVPRAKKNVSQSKATEEKAGKGPAKKATKENASRSKDVATDSSTDQNQEQTSPFQLSSKKKILEKYVGAATDIIVPDGITTIAEFAFANTPVKTVALPNSVKKIGNYAFSGCTELTQINIPSSVTSIGKCAFNRCVSLKEIIFPGSVKKLPDRVCDSCKGLTKAVVEEGVTEIKSLAFSFCKNLTALALPLSLTKVGEDVLLCSSIPTMYVYSGSYAESYAKGNDLPVEIMLTPEQAAEKKRQEDVQRIAEERYAAELKAWEQSCEAIRAQREQRVSELLDEKKAALKNEAQSTYDAAVASANKRKEVAKQKKADAETRLSTLGIFKFAEKKAANAIIQESENEIQAAESALVAAKQTLDKELAAIPATINSRKYMIAREVEYEYPLPAKPVR